MPPASSRLHLSRIGLGCVTFGREIDEAASWALLDHALARGVTSFDTAAAYSNGESEAIIGRWIASRRPDLSALSFATKIQPPYEPEQIRTAVDQSRRRLGIDLIPLLYLHRWDVTAETPRAWAALDDLVQCGTVGALGVSNCTLPQLAALADLQSRHSLHPIRAIQNNHNYAVREATRELREWCAANGIAVVTYSPLGAGFLTGKHHQEVQPGSRFAVAPGHQGVYFQPEACARLAHLEEISSRSGQPQAHLALAWALHQPGIDSVLVGGRTTAHLDQAFAALALNAHEFFPEESGHVSHTD